MKKLFQILPILLAFIFIGCSSSETASDPIIDTPITPETPIVRENIPGTYKRKLTLNNKEREFIVFIPESTSGKTEVPVVFMLHGVGGNGQKFHDRALLWTGKASKEGFIAIHPTALKHCYVAGGSTQNTTIWASGSLGHPNEQPLCSGQDLADDMKFFDEMVSIVKNEYAVDQKKIYVTGFSNGASMAARLAAERSDVFAAAAVHGGFISKFISNNLTKRPMSMILGFGANDQILARRLNTSTPVSVNANLTSNPNFLGSIQLYLDIHGISNESIYSDKNYGNFKAGEFLFNKSVVDNYNNTMKYILIENLDHYYPNILADVFWDFFKDQTLP